jgi:hypothetical protein
VSGLRIPSPPPIPTQVAATFRRAPSDTSPGIGDEERVPKVPGARMSQPSLLSTQVGLGVVRFDENGVASMVAKPVPPGRFLVREGREQGELVLTPIPDGATLPPGALVVTLSGS